MEMEIFWKCSGISKQQRGHMIKLRSTRINSKPPNRKSNFLYRCIQVYDFFMQILGKILGNQMCVCVYIYIRAQLFYLVKMMQCK